MAKATPEDVAAAFPEAVQFARSLRDVFGDGVKIVYARNAQGQEIGKRSLHTRERERLSDPSLI